MPTTSTPKVKLMTMTERTSRKGTRYLVGVLGHSTVIGFPGDTTEYGQEWNVYVQERTEKPATAHGSAAGASHSREREKAVRDFFRPF